ncbi:MAG: hypothetical protein H0T85_01200 [Geodermatophilaceae bacterium]|nr:hypothetical protein [Geodermatophilaceae bacterium]
MANGRPGRVSRPLALGAGVLLAVVATAALVLTDDLEILRLAVVGALWAFLIAAFLAGIRSPSPADVSTEVTLRRTHEWELEREVALRREAELNVEVRVRRELDAALREDIAGLRGDLLRLRQEIAERWDGELRVERVAVRAESTRVSGFGGTFHALQDEMMSRNLMPGMATEAETARWLAEHGRPLFEVEAREGGDGRRPVLVPTADALPGAAVPPHTVPAEAAAPPAAVRSPRDSASTVEFSAVPADDTPEQERTGPVYGLPVPPRPESGPVLEPEPEPGRRSRSRHQAGDDRGEDAAELVRRLSVETTGELPVVPDQPAPPRRRRRARDDDETNDVLARVLGEG